MISTTFRTLMCVALLCAFTSAAVCQTVLLVPDSTNDRVSAFDPFDGSIINLDFIPDDGVTLSTPINAISSTRGTIFVSDQIEDAVFEFAFDGSLIGTIADNATSGIDNVRGIDIFNGELYVTVAGGTFDNTIQKFDLDGGSQTTWAPVGDPFDIYFRTGGAGTDVLIANIADDRIDRHDLDGTFLGQFDDGTSGLNFPEQIQEASDGDVLVGGFSTPAGIYRFNPDGSLDAYLDVGTGLRGVYELGNGNLMFTSGSGVDILDTATGGITHITDGSYRFIEAVTIPEPGTLTLIVLGTLLLRLGRWKQP